MTGVRREVRTLTPACGSGQSKQRVDMTRVCVSVRVCVDGAGSQRFDLTMERGKKRVKPQTLRKQPLTSAAAATKKYTSNFYAHTPTRREKADSRGPGRGNYLISFISRRRNTNNCFSLSCIAPQRLTTPVICALRILIRPGAALDAAYSAPRIHAN